jgi:hypothetical protein
MTDSDLVAKIWMREPKDQVEFWVGRSGFGIRFPDFLPRISNLTEPNRFGLNRFSVQFGYYFTKLMEFGSVGFFSLNRIEP